MKSLCSYVQNKSRKLVRLCYSTADVNGIPKAGMVVETTKWRRLSPWKLLQRK